MKNVKTLFAAAVLSSLSFASFAAVEVRVLRQASSKSVSLVLLQALTSLLLKINWLKKRMRWAQNLSVSPL
jgi:hypothetical protein